MFDVVPCEHLHLRYVWDRRREHCRIEEDEVVVDHFHELSGWCARLGGEPVAVWGVHNMGDHVLAWGWQTEKVYRVWRKLTRVARAYYRTVSEQSGPVMLYRRDTEEQSRWLKFIGFQPTGEYAFGSHKYHWIGGDNRDGR